MNPKLFFFTVLFLVLLFGCTRENPQQLIALQINDLSITAYEVSKQATMHYGYGADRKSFDFEKFKRSLIDKYTLVAKAFDLQLDTLPLITDNVAYTAQFMMVQKYGFSWQRLVTPTIIDSMAITPDRLEKRKKLYHFQVLEITDSTFADDRISPAVFNTLVEESRQSPAVSLHVLAMQWPFQMFYPLRDSLFALHEGQIAKYNYNNQLLVFRLDKVDRVTISDSDKQKYARELQFIAEREYDTQKDSSIYHACKPVFNYTAINKIEGYLRQGNDFKDYPGNDTLISYFLNSENKNITFRDFQEPRQYYPFVKAIKTGEELYAALQQFMFNDYLVDEAQRHNLFEEQEFKLDRKNYLNNILYGYYLKNRIDKQIVIDSTEIVTYCQNNPDRFKTPRYALAHCFLFNTDAEAKESWRKIAAFYTANPVHLKLDKSEVPKLQSVLYDYKIDITESSPFVEEIKNLPAGQLSHPLPYQDKMALVRVYGTEGSYLRPINTAFGEIYSTLMAEKRALLLTPHLDSLRNQYPVNLDLLSPKLLN